MTDQGASEGLVERLAEAIGNALATSWVLNEERHETLTRATTAAVLPLVAAEVEAAVSVTRTEVERANQHADEWAATADRWTHRAAENGRRAEAAESDLRALREGVEALADEWWNQAEYDDLRPSVSKAMHAMVEQVRALIEPACPECGGTITTSGGRHEARCIRAVCRYVGPGFARALLASSPAERTSEAIPEAVWHEWHGDAPAPVSSGEACSSCGSPMDSPGCSKSPSRPGAFHTVSGGVTKAAPVVTPSTEGSE